MDIFEERKRKRREVFCPLCGGALEKSDDVWACTDCFKRFEMSLKQIGVPVHEAAKPYVHFDAALLDQREAEPVCNGEAEKTKQGILDVLSDYDVQGAEIRSVHCGPTVTQYNVSFPFYVDLSKITELEPQFSISLRMGQVRVFLNYEEGCVTVEVPNRERRFPALGGMLSEDTYKRAPKSSLLFALGKNMAGKEVYGDISKMIHMLVAGSPGSGKSIFIHSMLVSLLYRYSPEELRLILIDPKRIEFDAYNGLPHLATEKVVCEPREALKALDWAIKEMDRRYRLIDSFGRRTESFVVNVDQYNEKVEKADRLPKILIVIDELADLMLVEQRELENKVQSLAQKSRAAGIHLVLATQRPAKDVVTDAIRGNMPTRIAFAVPSETDSRTVLEHEGAQKLLGRGDMLYTMMGMSTPTRMQCAYVSDAEICRVVEFIKENNETFPILIKD